MASLFATRVGTFALGLVTTFILARILGPEGRGAYTLLLLIPTTLITLGQLGLPSALVFFAGRGRSLNELRTSAGLLVPVISIATVVPTLVLADTLRRTVIVGTPPNGIELILVAIPFLFASAYAGSILLGRQAIRTVNLIALAQAIASLFLLVVLVVIAGLGVMGAITAYVVVVVGSTLLSVAAAVRLAPFRFTFSSEATLRLVRYGLTIYPGSVAQFFSYRADVFLIALILASPRAVGLYGLAVGLAELVFYIPDAISTAFFPRIAGSEREEADRVVPDVTRLTVLMTTLAAVALIPFAIVAVNLLLPAFVDSLPALAVITPGIIGLSIAKVLSGYVSGLGKPLAPGLVALAAVVINIAANLVLIPAFGIIGAAAASLISYSATGIMLIVISSRLAGIPATDLVVPRKADVRRMVQLIRDIGQDLLARRPARLASRG